MNLFNEIIAGKSPDLMRELDKQTQEAFRTPNRYVEGKSSPKHYSQDVRNTKQRNSSEQKKKCLLIYRDRNIETASDLLAAMLRVRTHAMVGFNP